MVSSTRKSSLPPFTVVTQGSGLSYDDQILLDNLEYAIRVGGPATPRFLAQDGNVNGLARALSIGLTKVTSSEVRLRAGKLLTTLVEYVISHGNETYFSEFINGLGDKLFEPFLFHFKSEPREVSTTYLNAVGQAMGHRNLSDIISHKEMTSLLDAQRIRYVKCMSSLLETVTSEAIATSNSDGENGTSVSAPVITANTAGSMGYIPTVSGINPGMPDVTSVGDEQLNTVLAGLSAFLTRDENRWAFCGGAVAKGTGDEEDKASISKAVDYLAGLVQKDVGLPVQVHYQAIFCLWLLSFAGQHDPTSAMAERVSKAMDEASVPRRLASVLREASAEKVIRISLSTLRNLMKMSTLLRKEMVAAGLVGALETLCLRRWNDDDIRDDLGVLADALEKEHASMSTFDVYRAEILSGALDWTPPHRDETFWQQNVEKLESNNLEVLRCIVRVLNESTDKTVLSVACHDLAQFVKHHPRGRQIAQSLGVKGRLMELMVTGDGDVRRYALNGVQVLMITHWNLMQRTA